MKSDKEVLIYPLLYSKVPRWLADELVKRDDIGWKNHNRPMFPNDGRDMMQERHEELLDALVYQQTVEVEEGKTLGNLILWYILRLALYFSRSQIVCRKEKG